MAGSPTATPAWVLRVIPSGPSHCPATARWLDPCFKDPERGSRCCFCCGCRPVSGSGCPWPSRHRHPCPFTAQPPSAPSSLWHLGGGLRALFPTGEGALWDTLTHTGTQTTDTHTETQTYRHTQTYRDTDRQTRRQTETHTGIHTKHRHTHNTQTCTDIYEHTWMYLYSHTQTQTPTQRHRSYRHRHTDTSFGLTHTV